MHCTYNCNIEPHSRNQCFHVKAISITRSECVFVALVIRRVESMRRIVLPLYPVRLYNIFPHYLMQGAIFGKELLNTKCVI
jgi:hypothetical protein